MPVVPTGFLVGVGMVAVAWSCSDQPVSPPPAEKDGLSLTVRLDKPAYQMDEPIDLHFQLRNGAGRVLYVSDGFLAPAYHEAGPGRHFEVSVTPEAGNELTFRSGMSSEGRALSVRKVFRLDPGATYAGSIRLSAGAAADADRDKLPHGERGGHLEDAAQNRAHRLGKDGQKYRVALRYRVDPESQGPLETPDAFQPDQLWTGVLYSAPVTLEIVAR